MKKRMTAVINAMGESNFERQIMEKFTINMDDDQVIQLACGFGFNVQEWLPKPKRGAKKPHEGPLCL